MKKRTLVCFLIFTLCVFYTAIPNTVFGQEEEASLAEQVFEKYQTTLEDPAVKSLLPGVLAALSDPATLENPTIAALGGFDAAVDLLLGNPNLITTVVPDATPKVIALLGTEPIQTMFKDPEVRTLMQDAEAVKELAASLQPPAQPDPEPTEPEPPVQPEASLAQKVFEKYQTTLEDPAVKSHLPLVLEALSNPATLESPQIAQLGGFDAAVDLLLTTPTLITAVVPTAGPEVIALLETEPIQTMFKDPDVRTLMQDAEAVKELAALLAAEPTVPTEPTEPDTTEPTEPDTTEPDTTEPDTTEPDTTEPTEPDTTEPDTTEPDTTEPTEPPTEPVEPPTIERATPFDPIMPENVSILGKSRLGGLSMNKISGQQFLDEFVMEATGLNIAALSPQARNGLIDMIVPLITEVVPLPKNQIQQILDNLKRSEIPIFAGKLDEQELAHNLDDENFGNPITPMLLDLIYDDGMGDQTDPNRKYLTRDSLNLYVRVPLPSANVGRVTFGNSDGSIQAEGRPMKDPTVLGSEKIPYTFRLEEVLAATHLPAWPALEDNLEQLFSNVTVHYSTELDNDDGFADEMHPTFTDNGVVWESHGIEVPQGNIYYYFEVELATPVTLEVLAYDKLKEQWEGALEGNLPSPSDVLSATLDQPLEIKKWAMPDPRNLQLADRGILEALFDEDFQEALRAVALPLFSGDINQQEIFSALQKDGAKLQRILTDNALDLITQFESAFDPMLSSVFSIPKIDPESESLWVAELPDIPEGNHFIGAIVYDTNDNALDQMWSDVTVDTEAPEADVAISAGDNTVVYHDGDEYIATALEPGAATLKVTGNPKPGSYVGQPRFDGNRYQAGYLFYQIIGLNPDGTPYLDKAKLQRPNTWMPLTPEATMLASTVWEQTIAQLVHQDVLPEDLDLAAMVAGELGFTKAAAADLLQTATKETVAAILGIPETDAANLLRLREITKTEDLTLDIVKTVLPILAYPIPLGFIENNPQVGPMIKSLEAALQVTLLDPQVMKWAVDVFGATENIINHIPITYSNPDNDVMMLAQLGADVLAGHYGIRALGVDTLFNVSSHTEPTRLRIVDAANPMEQNRASVILASIRDRNGDLVGSEYGRDIIYANTTKGVDLTITIGETPHHLYSIAVEYQDANGDWQLIDTLSAEGAQMGDPLTVTWDATDAFTALVDTGNVMVRAVATNKLQITDATPEPFSIELHPGIYPPEVLNIKVDEGTDQNPDSGAPQGTVTITATTEPLTGPETGAVRFEAKRPTDEDWMTLGTDEALVSAVEAAVDAAVEGATAAPISHDGIWSITVDTTTMNGNMDPTETDTITKDNPGAREASKDDNQYVIRAFAVSADGMEWPSDATEMLSVDNVDDVEPEGPTNITAVANADGAVAADPDGGYTLRGLVDDNDPSVVPQTVTLTIEPAANRNTYKSVMLVSDPAISADLISAPAETSEGSGVFTVTVNIGELGIAGNGPYKIHALAYDEFDNVQSQESSEYEPSPKHTIHVKNYERPDPTVFDLTVDDGTGTNVDSGGTQGTFTFTAHTIEPNSPSIKSILLEAKRASDTEWKEIGTGDVSTPVDIEDLPDVLDHLLGIADEGTREGDKSVVSLDVTKKQWVVTVDTEALELEDTITKDSPAARGESPDDNQYTVRAYAVGANGEKSVSDDVTVMFSLDNIDDVAPLESTSVSVTSVDGVETVLEPNGERSYTVGGLVDKYDDAVASPVATFTIEPIAKRETYKSVTFTTDAEGTIIGEITETAEGSGVFTVTVDVGTLTDGETYLDEGTYTFQALAYDGVNDVVEGELGNEEADTEDSKVSVTVDNDYRPAPEVLVISVDPESITQRNPDSGAPQGTLTLKARTHPITSPPTSGMLFEVKRPSDEEWIEIDTASEEMQVSEVSDKELADFVGDVAGAAVMATETSEPGEATVVAIDRNQANQEWMLEVNTTELEDTITADSPAARDASQDDNQYMVRVTAIATAAKDRDPEKERTMSADGIAAHFSVDNVDDVEPVGPTKIVAVADVAGMIDANEDGSYTVGGIVDDTVPSPIAIFTTEPAANPATYDSVNLVQTTGEVSETVVEGEAGSLDLTIDVGLLENGTYMFHALAVDEFGNIQTDESPMVTVHVLNFRVEDVADIAVIAVDGTDADAPEEPISLRDSVTVSFMVANGSLAAEELSGAVNGATVPSESESAEAENTFTLKVMVGGLADGIYVPDGRVTKRNGSVDFAITQVNVDNTGPMITIESPNDGDTVESLPTVHATYNDGAGSGTDKDGQEVLPWATTELADGPTVAITRLQPEQGNTDVDVDQNVIETDNGTLVYTRTDQLPGGAYQITVQVADVLGNVGTASREFVINGTLPTVTIHSPAPGQTFEHGEPLISGEFSGIDTVEVTTFTINDVEATPEVDGNQFSYTPEEALANDNYKVVVGVTDSDGNTAQKSVVFVVDIPEPPKDTSPPVISAAAPNGIIKDTDSDKLGAVVISAVVTDEQSAITSVKYSINGGVSRSIATVNIADGKIQAPVDFETHGPGLYTVSLSATSQGGTTNHVWTFTLALDNVKPTITSITPSGTIRGGLPVISASASDDSGVDKITIAVMNAAGKEVKGKTADDGEEGVEGITRLDFNPEEPLDEGIYTIEVRATDTLGNSASAKGSFTIDFDTAAPVITMATPQNEARLTERRPQISITYADAESGVDVDSIRFVFDDKLINLTPNQKSASQVLYTPAADLAFGQHTVKLEVSDMAHKEGNVSEKNKGARKANMAVHEFTFFVESEEGPVLASRPINVPNPFKDNTRISFTLTRQSTLSIIIYDTTLRPVRVLVDNEVWDAGEYIGKAAIGWDGTTTAGEDLARGVYFCQIIVADGFEPEYVILKLALTR